MPLDISVNFWFDSRCYILDTTLTVCTCHIQPLSVSFKKLPTRRTAPKLGLKPMVHAAGLRKAQQRRNFLETQVTLFEVSFHGIYSDFVQQFSKAKSVCRELSVQGTAVSVHHSCYGSGGAVPAGQ